MRVLEKLHDAVRSGRGGAAADALCRVCVEYLAVDAAAVSLVFDGVNAGTLGTSGSWATELDEVQFTLGQGPCLDSVARRGPVLVGDLDHSDENRWPAYRAAMAEHQVRGVFAFPVQVAGEFVGALDLFCSGPGELTRDDLAAALTAADLAAMPVLDAAFPGGGVGPQEDEPAWHDLYALCRVEVAQATGMLIAQLGVDPVQALARLRAHAYATGRSATDTARDVLSRTLRLEPDPPLGDPPSPGRP